jgi:nucleoside-diphosphate-sugar epimerase
MPLRILVTGASGFVGSAIIAELTARGHFVNALSHRRPVITIGDQVRSIPGDIFDNRALDEGMRGCQAVIHLVGIIMEKPAKGITFDRIHHQGANNVIDAALRNGIRRFLDRSALGVRQDAVSD